MAYDFPASPAVGTIYAPQGGPSWQWNGTAWTNISPVSVVSNIVVTVIPGPATGNYVKPAGLKFLEVWVVGGGGAGSRAGANAAGTSSAGAGGGGGGMSYNLYAAADLAASEPYTVGGAGTASGGVGGAGGSSTFKGQTANPGAGGGGLMTAGSVFARTVSRGGAGTASGGMLNVQGGNGGWGYAGMHGSGSYAQGGTGGNSFFAVATIDLPISSGQIGPYDGRFPGGGGSGESSSNGAAVGTGTTGANGMIMLKEYY